MLNRIVHDCSWFNHSFHWKDGWRYNKLSKLFFSTRDKIVNLFLCLFLQIYSHNFFHGPYFYSYSAVKGMSALLFINGVNPRWDMFGSTDVMCKTVSSCVCVCVCVHVCMCENCFNISLLFSDIQCAIPMCENFCEHGYVYNSYGCMTCECNDMPTECKYVCMHACVRACMIVVSVWL